ncbi:MAG TPA: ATP-binding cassette domain-containing protein [Thermoanaerobaculia bacterium]
MADAIHVRGVTKTFGPKVAVRDLDLTVPEGGLYGFIGPNGAGKTTTIRMVMSILFPDRGELSVLGHKSALEAKDRIGYLPEERGVHRKMKVGSFLAYVARLKGQKGSGLRHKVHAWLERVGLAEVENKRCEELSKGMQQKIQFVSAVLHEPELLILDEPFSGLDPVNMRLLRDLVLEQHRRGATIIFSTHVMVQAEQICRQIVMINDGEKVLDDSLAEIRTRFDPRTILFEPMSREADASPLERIGGVERVSRADGAYEIGLADGCDPSAAMREIVAAIPTARIELHRPTLEDVFIRIVQGSQDASARDVERLRASLRSDAPAEARP